MEIYGLFGVFTLFSCTDLALAEIHSHYFFMTVTSDSASDFPSYFTIRTVDDVPLFWYDSNNGIIERRVPWFKSTSANLLIASVQQYNLQIAMQNLLQDVMDHLNQTEGYHVLQRLEGCTAYDNGTIQTVFRYGYDGKSFLSFNVDTANWTADVPEAQYFTDMMNDNVTIAEQNRDTLLNECIPHITELLLLGNQTFARKERPVVSVTQTPMRNASSRLGCRAYGHYPKDIVMVWYKNGQEVSEEVTDTVTLPLPDLLYLSLSSFNITPSADDIYTCEVSHSSFTEPYTQDWKVSVNPLRQTSGPSNGVVIAICLAVILVLVILAFGWVSLGKWRRQ